MINVTVNDSYGLVSQGYFNLTVYNQSRSPVIYNVTPGDSSNLTKWYDVAIYFPDNITNISISENIGDLTFNHTTIDPDGDMLLYKWYLNGTYVSNNHSFSYEFNYNSSGNYNLTLVVADNVSGYELHNVSFVWKLSVLNVNRPPYLTNNFSDLTVGGSSFLSDYFTSGDSRFVDPDGDQMNFSVYQALSSLQHCTISIEGDDLYIYATSTGEDSVYFIADDGQDTTLSNNVTINITWIAQSEGTSETETQTSSRTRTTTVTQTIIEEVEIETPVYFDILVPEPTTLYINNTLRAPISLYNTGNITLKGIKLGALSNNSLIDITFSDDFIPQLNPNQKITTDLLITSFKTFSNYEIYVYANITDPEYSDSAIIYVNSLEKTKGDQSVTNTKITFARDILSNNVECLELNEFLKKAEDAINNNDYDSASVLLDAVIEGCKYLVSQSKLKKEEPTFFTVFDIFDKMSTFNIIILVALVAVILFVILLLLIKKK